MKKLLVVGMIILLVGMSVPSTGINVDKSTTSFNGKTLYVGGDGPGNYSKIQDAINDSSDGDTVFVYSGIYYENLILNKSINLIGEETNITIIDGENNGHVVEVFADEVVLQNFSIRNSGGYKYDSGILLDANYNDIKECIFYRTKTGIILNGFENNTIDSCIFYSNGEGISLDYCINNKITNCYFTHNAIGVTINHSKSILITECYADTNGIGIFCNSSKNIVFTKCAIYNNNNNQGGILIYNCQNISISNSNIYHNGFGIKIMQSSEVQIAQSNLNMNTHVALHILKDSQNIDVNSCEFSNNLRIAIVFWEGAAKINHCNIYGSLFGLEAEHSQGDLTKNWWGSTAGPALFERKIKDRIFFFRCQIKIFPWLSRKNTEAGTEWEINEDLFQVEINISRFQELNLSGLDSDNDKVPNWWEEKWGYDPLTWDDHSNIDPDNDGLNNIEECYTDNWNSNPFHKDIFLECDLIESKNSEVTNNPSGRLLNKMKTTFSDHNITLHFDDGELDGGEILPYKSNFTYSDLIDLYWEYFLHNDLNNPRKGIFHYCIICDYGPESGFAFIGWDNLDSFLISSEVIQNRNPFIQRKRLIVGGMIHEFGHTLGLNVDDHGGNDNIVATKAFLIWLKYIGYRSCMNYWYTYRVIDFSEGKNGPGDFDDWNNFELSFFKNTQFLPNL